MKPDLRAAARVAIGFMPEEEGLALYEWARRAPAAGPLLEIGSYCGKSAIYLGAAAQERGEVLFSIDHHRGSEEHQPGEEYFDPRLVDAASGKVDTLPTFRKTISEAGLENVVISIVGRSATVAAVWDRELAMVFIDGSHNRAAAEADYAGWAPHITRGGLLAIHDVFEDPSQGGRPPFDIYRRALESNAFEEVGRKATLRVLQRVGDGV